MKQDCEGVFQLGTRINKAHSTSNVVKAALAIQLVALLVLAIFRSDKLLSYTYDLEPGYGSEKLVLVAQYWHQQMEVIGITSFSTNVIEFIDEIRAADEF